MFSNADEVQGDSTLLQSANLCSVDIILLNPSLGIWRTVGFEEPLQLSSETVRGLVLFFTS